MASTRSALVVFTLLLQLTAASVSLTVNGVVPSVGATFTPSQAYSVVLTTGITQITFSSSSNFAATSVKVSGVEILYGATGTSFYFDAAGNNGMTVSTMSVVRLNAAIAEIALFDTTGTPLRHEVHYIIRSGRNGIYGYHILTAVAPTSITEVRHVVRFNRCLLNHIYNGERGISIHPTGAYLGLMPGIQDSTWQCNGSNIASLPCPMDNSGNIAPNELYNPPNYVWSKYLWSLYHSENPFFGHLGNGFGVFLTPLSGITDTTSAASYGGGPLHQDLAVHHDALIANYNHRNHYGSPGEAVDVSLSRFFGPWLHFFVNRTNTSDLSGLIADAAAIAAVEISSSIPALPWINDPRYPPAAGRVNVTGLVVVTTDTRPADLLWALLSTQSGSDTVYNITAPTWFVRTQPDGSFAIPGIPSGTYSLYVWPSGGAMIGLGEWDGIVVNASNGGGTLDLGVLSFAPVSYSHYLWSIGATNGEGGEFALGNSTREWLLPTVVPGSLNYVIGQSWEPAAWWYAQTTGGTWTVSFTLSQAYSGTAHLTVAASMTDYYSPAVTLNGASTGLIGNPPSGSDSTINRQAVRSGSPRVSEITFPASQLQIGVNTIAFSRACCNLGPNVGMGYDAVLLEVDDGSNPALSLPAISIISATHAPLSASDPLGPSQWNISVINGAAASGTGTARLVLLEGAKLTTSTGVTPPPLLFFAGRDPTVHPLPVVEELAPGASAVLPLTFTSPVGCIMGQGSFGAVSLVLTVSSNGRRVVESTALPWPCASRTPSPTPSLYSSHTITPTGTSSASGSPLPSATSTMSPTPMSTPSSSQTAGPSSGVIGQGGGVPFLAGSVAALRCGDSVTGAVTLTSFRPLYIDEFVLRQASSNSSSSSGNNSSMLTLTLRQSIALPSVATVIGGVPLTCLGVSASSGAALMGLQLAGDGLSLVLTCYNVSVGTSGTVSSATPRLVAQVFADGSVRYYPVPLSSVYFPLGNLGAVTSMAIFAGIVGGSTGGNGLMVLSPTGQLSASVNSGAWRHSGVDAGIIGSLSSFGGALYLSTTGAISFGGASYTGFIVAPAILGKPWSGYLDVENGQYAGEVAYLNTSALASPRGFCISPASGGTSGAITLWASEFSTGLYCVTSVSGVWSQSPAYSPAPMETAYTATAVSADGELVFLTGARGIYAFNASSLSWLGVGGAPLVPPPSGAVFRGLAVWPSLGIGALSAFSSSASSSPPPSTTSSFSRSLSSSLSATPSLAQSFSSTATVSRSATPSLSPTATPTASSAVSSSVTAPPSPSLSASLQSTTTGTAAGTSTGTTMASRSSSYGPTPTPSAVSSPSASLSASLQRSATDTGTGSNGPTPLSTPSSGLTSTPLSSPPQSASVSRSTSRSRSSSRTPSSSVSGSSSSSASPSASTSGSSALTHSPSLSSSETVTASITTTGSTTSSPSTTASASLSSPPTQSSTVSAPLSKSFSAPPVSMSRTSSRTWSSTASPSRPPTGTKTDTHSRTGSRSGTRTTSATRSISKTASPSRSPAASKSSQVTKSATRKAKG